MLTSEEEYHGDPKKLSTLYLILGLMWILYVIVLVAAMTSITLSYISGNVGSGTSPENVHLPAQAFYTIIITASAIALAFNIVYSIIYYMMSVNADIFIDKAFLYKISAYILMGVSLLQIISATYTILTITPEVIEQYMAGVGTGVLTNVQETSSNIGLFSRIFRALGYTLMGYSLFSASKEYTNYSPIRTGSVLLFVGGIISFIPILEIIGGLLIFLSFFFLYSELKNISVKTEQQSEGLLSFQ